jgi:predicted CXXCH cytochrome family protein
MKDVLLVVLLLAALGPRLAAQTQSPARIERGQTCLDCHQGLTEAHNSHQPVRDGKCGLCHLQAAEGEHRFTAPPQPGKVCVSCHELPARATPHAPVVQQDCLACHTAHPAPGDPYRRNLLTSTSEREVCARCHAGEAGVGQAFVHTPVAGGACTQCHVPHSSTEPRLLRKPPDPTCSECHAGVHARLGTAASRHVPVSEDCRRCHDAHASDQRAQLVKAPGQLCLDCHAPLLAEYEARPVFHRALLTDEGCANCHAAHDSPLPKLLAMPVGELCLACHSQPIVRPDGRTIASVGHELAGAKSAHGALPQGACEACHDPHGAHTFALLCEPYPREFYAPFRTESYALCFRCHAAEAFTSPTTTSATRFRDGPRNLHFLHVNQAKGRTCRACHATHASTLPAQLAESVPFGSWALPLRFERIPGGGACTPGCHERTEYRAGANPGRVPP